MRQSWRSLYGFCRPVPKNLKASGAHLSGTEYEVMPLSDCHLQIGRSRMSGKVEGLSHQRCSMRTKVSPTPTRDCRHAQQQSAVAAAHSQAATHVCKFHIGYLIAVEAIDRCWVRVVERRSPWLSGRRVAHGAEPTVHARTPATWLAQPCRKWTCEQRGSMKPQNDRTAGPTKERQPAAYEIGKPRLRLHLGRRARYRASK